jgi:hypothetical protein
MYFVILDSTGNLVESFDDETSARNALERMVHEDPEAADHLALLTYDAQGEPVGDAITVSAPSPPSLSI